MIWVVLAVRSSRQSHGPANREKGRHKKTPASVKEAGLKNRREGRSRPVGVNDQNFTEAESASVVPTS
jgi:hypothetical protein